MAMTDGAVLQFTYPLSELLAAAAIFLYNNNIKNKKTKNNGLEGRQQITLFTHSWAMSIHNNI